jgi:hypothetical protein
MNLEVSKSVAIKIRVLFYSISVGQQQRTIDSDSTNTPPGRVLYYGSYCRQQDKQVTCDDLLIAYCGVQISNTTVYVEYAITVP